MNGAQFLHWVLRSRSLEAEVIKLKTKFKRNTLNIFTVFSSEIITEILIFVREVLKNSKWAWSQKLKLQNIFCGIFHSAEMNGDVDDIGSDSRSLFFSYNNNVIHVWERIPVSLGIHHGRRIQQVAVERQISPFQDMLVSFILKQTNNVRLESSWESGDVNLFQYTTFAF